MTRALLRYLAFSSDKFPPFRVDTTELFGHHLTALDHRFDWVMQSDGDCDRSYIAKWNSNRVFVGKTDNGSGRLSRIRKHAWSLLHSIDVLIATRHRRYQLILVKNKYLIAVFALAVARLRDIPFVFWMSYPHSEEDLMKVRQGLARYPFIYWIRGHCLTFLLYGIILRLAAHIFVQSEQMKLDMESRGIPSWKLTPVPMGVSLEQFDVYKNTTGKALPFGDSTARREIVYLGTLQKARKMDFMVRVLAKVLLVVPYVHMTFVGDGDNAGDRDLLLEEARVLGITSAMDITGFLPRKEAMSYVSRADVCVSPFYPDPILLSASPTKLVEYWAMEKPVVANDHPEQSRTIGESSGGLCTPYREDAFAKAIIEILQDPERGRVMGRRGRAFVEANRSYVRIAADVDEQLRKVALRVDSEVKRKA